LLSHQGQGLSHQNHNNALPSCLFLSTGPLAESLFLDDF
jgi:hypothetical protein